MLALKAVPDPLRRLVGLRAQAAPTRRARPAVDHGIPTCGRRHRARSGCAHASASPEARIHAFAGKAAKAGKTLTCRGEDVRKSVGKSAYTGNIAAEPLAFPLVFSSLALLRNLIGEQDVRELASFCARTRHDL